MTHTQRTNSIGYYQNEFKEREMKEQNMNEEKQSFNSANLLHNNGGFENSDEAYTPDYGVKPIIKYIPKDAVVWCPFDTEESEFVKQIKANGNKVIVSHIDNGGDFFEYEPSEEWDMIISNPPFKKKRLFFERALTFKKPFALLMTLAVFNDKYPAMSFYEAGKTMQLLKFDKRIKFTNPDGRDNKKITFQSGYLCADFLPSDLILEEI